MAALTFDAFLPEMEKMETLKNNGYQKTNFGPHGDQSPQIGTNVGAVQLYRPTFPSRQIQVFSLYTLSEGINLLTLRELLIILNGGSGQRYCKPFHH